MKGLLLYLKDKQFYTKEKALRILGSFNSIRRLMEEYDLLHIIDLDLERGRLKNLDVYDVLTREIHTQVEVSPKHVEKARKLQELNVRVVLLPDYQGWDSLNEKFLAARVEEERQLWISEKVRDILTSSKEIAEKLSDKNRLFFIGKHEKAFCNIDIKTLRN